MIIETTKVGNSIFFHGNCDEVYRLSIPGTTIKDADKFQIRTADNGWFHDDDADFFPAGVQYPVQYNDSNVMVIGPIESIVDQNTFASICNAYNGGWLMELEHYYGKLDKVMKGKVSPTPQAGGVNYIFQNYEMVLQFVEREFYGGTMRSRTVNA